MPALKNARHERFAQELAKGETADADGRFYVYAVRINGQTRYVGKGCGKRAQIHLTRSHNETLAAEVRAARATGKPVRVRVIRDGMTEGAAFKLERRLIARWRSRLANVAMGSFTPLQHAAMQAKANLERLKTEEQVRQEGAFNGVSGDQRVVWLRRIRAELAEIAAAA